MNSLIKLGVGGALLTLASMSNAALLDGETLNVQYFFPDLNTPIDTPFNGNLVVGPGVELIDVAHTFFDSSADFSDTQIKVVFSFTDVEFDGDFVGARVSDVFGQIRPFTSFTVNASSTALGFGQNRLSFDQNNLFINFAGYSYVAGTQLVFDIAAAPVPEPEISALMLLGLGVLGSVARRRCIARR